MKHKSLSSIRKDVRKDYTKRVIFDVNELPAGGHVLQEVTIPPQTRQRAHYHNEQTEVFYILEGESRLVINDTEFNAVAGDAFICAPGDVHYLRNETDTPFRLLVMKINRPADREDSVWMEEV